MITTDDIASIMDAIWQSLFGAELTYLGSEHAPGPLTEGQGSLVGVVQITGVWEGSVMVECDSSLARDAAGAMFGMSGDDVGSEEVHDALGELANMAAGNIKSLLPAPAWLSLPTVTQGVELGVSIPGSPPGDSAAFESDGRHITVSVFQREGD